MKKSRLTNKEKEECIKLTNELEDLLKNLGWSKKDFAREIMSPNEEENTVYERIKKDLQRGRKGMKHPNFMQKYINDILKHKDYKKLHNRIIPSPDDFSKEEDKKFIKDIIEICRNFSKK